MKDFISGKMQGMRAYLPPQVGEYFLAVGVRFTSFELLDSFAPLTVQFGEHFEVDVLGISTMLVPPNVQETPIAEAQLLLKAAVIPDEGIVLIQAQLTNDSYILSRDCHLTGGFAFASWFKGEHAGDFVVTLGWRQAQLQPSRNVRLTAASRLIRAMLVEDGLHERNQTIQESIYKREK